MTDDPSRGGRTVDSAPPASDGDSTAGGNDADRSSSVDAAGSVGDPDPDPVDDAVKRRLREAYLNDEESVLRVTAVRSAAEEVVVELRPPHGGTTHVERFPAPRHGSLSESEAFLTFLSAAGVSPLDVDELVGAEIPATYDPETGWQIDKAYVRDREDGSRRLGRVERSVSWFRQYRYWLLAGGLIVGELLFVVVIILLYT